MNKNRLSKLLLNTVVTAVLGAVLGVLTVNIIDMSIKDIPLDPLYVLVFFSLLVIMLVLIILFRIETVDEYRYEVINSINEGFMPIEKESISFFAANLVLKSSFVRTVGTARQDVLKSTSQKSARAYLQSFEKKLNTPPKDEVQKFTYLRVLPKNANNEMKQHIMQCQEKSQKTGNVFCIKETDFFDFYISFTIFDDKHLLLILDNPQHSGSVDNVLCLWTKHAKTIRYFINHFDNAWKK